MTPSECYRSRHHVLLTGFAGVREPCRAAIMEQNCAPAVMDTP